MIRLKSPEEKTLSAFHVCEIEHCKNEADKIYANSETRIIDICLDHYNQIISNGEIS